MTRAELQAEVVGVLKGLGALGFTGNLTDASPAWVASVTQLFESDSLLHGCSDHDKPRYTWEIMLKVTSDKAPSNHKYSPKDFLQYKRTEILTKEPDDPEFRPATWYPDIQLMGRWLLDEFPSDGAHVTLQQELMVVRPTTMDAKKLMEDINKSLLRLRKLEENSAQQRTFEQQDGAHMYTLILECVDHFERMYKLMRADYLARLKARGKTDVYEVPVTFALKQLFMQAAAVWETAHLQAAYDTRTLGAQPE